MKSETRKTYVIGVSGPSGAGKTTLVHNLAALLEDATVFILEHYQAAENRKKAEQGDFVLHDPVAWEEAQYDLNVMAPPPPGSIEDLDRLIQGQEVHPPDSARSMRPARFILLEGGCRDLDVLNPRIDLAVHLDIPLDISLCRVLVRFERNGGKPMAWVHNYLDYSLHSFYARLQRSRDKADMVVDGLRPENEIAAEVAKEIQSRFA